MNKYDMGKFINFLKEKNIFQIAFATVISERIMEMTSVCTNSILLKKNYERHIRMKDNTPKNKLETYYFDIFSVRIEIGKILFVVIKFVLIMYIMFITGNLFCTI